MNSTKGLIIYVILTVVVYLVIMFTLSLVEVNKIPLVYHTNTFYSIKGGDSFEKFQEYDLTEHHEIVFLGSSRSYRHYDPAIFENAGVSTFNLGTGSQSIRESYKVLEHYIDSQNTNMVIYDLYIGAMRLPGSLESASNLIGNISKNVAALDIALDMNDSRAINLYFMRCLMENKSSMYTEEGYQGRGFCINQDMFDIEKLNPVNSQENIDRYNALDHEELRQLEELILKCNKKGVRLILVNSPTSKYYSIENHESFLQQIQPILDEYQITFLDYAKKLSIPTETHFYDYSHMNYDGVKVFNQQLIEDLNENLKLFERKRK
jgi:hypothetical protein